MLQNKIPWICFLTVLMTTSSVQYSCRNENDEPVDWFVIYKLPSIRYHKNRLVKLGHGYAYISSDDNQGWILSEKSIAHRFSLPGATLAPMYKRKSKNKPLYIVYNDQPPLNIYSQGGHAKGVVLAGKTKGFWLIHSVPLYPAPPSHLDHNRYPKSGFRNGQSFLCITLKKRDLELAASQLNSIDPAIYAKSVPGYLKRTYPLLSDLAVGNQDKYSAMNKSHNISTAAKTMLRVFSKSSDFGRDLYSKWINSDLQTSLWVQTWQHSKVPLPSVCTGRYRIENVQKIKIAGVSFPSTKDHSKWAISMSENKPWVCIGDINRDESQIKRGGGTVCMKDWSLWKAYKDGITSKEECPLHEYKWWG